MLASKGSYQKGNVSRNCFPRFSSIAFNFLPYDKLFPVEGSLVEILKDEMLFAVHA